MLPIAWGDQTFGENMEWLEGVWRKTEAKVRETQYAAWAYGAAARVAIASALSSNPVIPYPTKYTEMWRQSDEGEDLIDGEEDERSEEEKADAAWMMERDLLIMRLQNAQARNSKEGD